MLRSCVRGTKRATYVRFANCYWDVYHKILAKGPHCDPADQGAGLGYELLQRPLLPWAMTAASGADVLFELIFGMLCLGTLQTADRWKRVSALFPRKYGE